MTRYLSYSLLNLSELRAEEPGVTLSVLLSSYSPNESSSISSPSDASE